MMPDLGPYASEIELAYAVSLSLLAALIGWLWARTRRVRQALETLETRLKRKP